MKKLKTILLDCDGPLADFCQGFLASIEEETGHAFGSQVITTWNITDAPFFEELAKEVARSVPDLRGKIWQRVKRIGWCAALQPVPGAKEAIRSLREIAEHVEVLTAPLDGSPTWMPERTEWLHRHFGFHHHDVHFSHRKERFRGDVLVDDKTGHVEAFEAEPGGGHGLLWDAPYNRGGDPARVRATTWEEVVAYCQNLRELRADVGEISAF